MHEAQAVDHLVIARLTGQPVQAIVASPAAQAMGEMMIRDGLTGLYNRRYLDCRLPLAMAAAAAAAAQVSLLVIDLNNFKQLNDTLGHEAGDRLLIATARTISQQLGGAGAGIRYGGDEFVIVLPGWAGSDAHSWAVKLLDTLGGCSVALPGERTVPGINASLGLATWPDDAQDGAGLFAAADVAMYHAKRQARAGVCRFTDLRRGREARRAVPTGRAAPFVGREPELARLRPALRTGGQLFCCTGPTGVGKSRLAGEVAVAARASGWRTLTCAGAESGALGGLRRLLQAAVRDPDLQTSVQVALGTLPTPERDQITALLAPEPAIAGADPPATAGAPPAAGAAAEDFVGAVARLLASVAAHGRLWIVVDEVHVWDGPSLALWRHLGTGWLSDRLVGVVALNPNESPQAPPLLAHLQQMAADGLPVQVLELGPLPELAMVELIHATLVGDVDPSVVQELLRQAAGNPLSLHTLVQGWMDQGYLDDDDGGWRLRSGPRTASQTDETSGPSVTTTLQAQLLALPEDLRQMLAALSVSPHPWTPTAVARLCGATTAEVTEWLQQAERREILEQEAGGYRFAHGAIRALLRRTTSALLHRAWHRLAVALPDSIRPATAAQRAEHFEEGGDPDAAIHWHVRAAAEAERLVASASVGYHLRRAAELAGDRPELADQRERWWQRAGAALQLSGRVQEAISCLRRAVGPQTQPEDAADCLNRLVYCHLHLGQRSEAGQCLETALQTLRDGPPTMILPRLYLHQAYMLSVWDNDAVAALAAVRRAAALARAGGWHSELAAAFAERGLIHHRRGEAAACRRWLRRALTIPDVTPLAQLYALDRAIRLEPRPDRRLEMAFRAQAEAARCGLTRNVLVSYEAIVTALGTLGRWEEARQASVDWRRLAWRSGTLEDVLWSYCNWADFAWHHGLVAELDIISQRCQQLLGGHQQSNAYWDVVRLELTRRLARAEADQALAHLNAILGDERPRQSPISLVYFLAAEAALAREDPDQAEIWLNEASQCGPTSLIHTVPGRVTLIQGTIAELRGQFDQALDAFARARRGVTRPWDCANAYLRDAAVRARLGPMGTKPGGTPARGLARRALAMAQRLGYPNVAQAAATLLAGM